MTDNGLFFVTLPKSGTDYIWFALSELTRRPTPPFLKDPEMVKRVQGVRDFPPGVERVISCGDFYTQSLIPADQPNSNLGKFWDAGYIFGAHMQASQHNLACLREIGVPGITVQLRDPRDSVISWTYHVQRNGPAVRHQHSKSYHLPREYYDWPFERQLAFNIRTYLPMAVNFVEGWFDAAADPETPFPINIVFFDQMKRFPRTFFERITRFHGFDDVNLESLPEPEWGTRHFRKGENDQWTYEFSEDDQAFSQNLIGDRLREAYERAANADPDALRANDLRKEGRYQEACHALFGSLTRFSCSRRLQQTLIDALHESGAKGPAGLVNAMAMMQSKQVESVFRHDDRMLADLRDILQTLPGDSEP